MHVMTHKQHDIILQPRESLRKFLLLSTLPQRNVYTPECSIFSLLFAVLSQMLGFQFPVETDAFYILHIVGSSTSSPK